MKIKITYPNGYYVGETEFKYAEDGVNYYIRQGQGEMVYNNGMREIGTWVNDKKEGVCTVVYADGDVFVGEFKHNIKQGKGTFKFAQSGNVYNVLMVQNKAVVKIFDHKEDIQKLCDKEIEK